MSLLIRPGNAPPVVYKPYRDGWYDQAVRVCQVSQGHVSAYQPTSVYKGLYCASRMAAGEDPFASLIFQARVVAHYNCISHLLTIAIHTILL